MSEGESTATGRAAAPRTSGPVGCVLAAVITGVMGFGSVLAGKVFFERKNASVLGGAEELAAILTASESAPGAAAVKALGCEAAGVLSPAELRELGERLELEDARRKNRTPKPVTVGVDDTVVFCGHPAEIEPSGAKVAEVYRGAAPPAAPFVVTVRTGFRETCVERFDTAGASLGPAPSPNLPLLVAPR